MAGKPLQYGLIAEEVAESFPELAAHGADGQIETVKYQLLPVLLLNEVQKQRREIQEQRSMIEKQQGTISQQEVEMKAMAARLAKLEALLAPQR